MTTIGDNAFRGLGSNLGGDAANEVRPRRKAREVNPDDDLLAGRTFVTLPEAVTFIGRNALADVAVVESFISEPERVQTNEGVAPVINGICRIPYGLTERYEAAQWTSSQFIERERDAEDAVSALPSAPAQSVGIYNLSGQRLTAPRRGVNIIGGRKVVVK